MLLLLVVSSRGAKAEQQQWFTSYLHSQANDLIAGGKSKKTKRTAPKSDDIYLKLLVKVHLTLRILLIL